MGAEKGGSKSSSFFHLFDWNKKSRKKLFSSGTNSPGKSILAQCLKAAIFFLTIRNSFSLTLCVYLQSAQNWERQVMLICQQHDSSWCVVHSFNLFCCLVSMELELSACDI